MVKVRVILGKGFEIFTKMHARLWNHFAAINVILSTPDMYVWGVCIHFLFTVT